MITLVQWRNECLRISFERVAVMFNSNGHDVCSAPVSKLTLGLQIGIITIIFQDGPRSPEAAEETEDLGGPTLHFLLPVVELRIRGVTRGDWDNRWTGLCTGLHPGGWLIIDHGRHLPPPAPAPHWAARPTPDRCILRAGRSHRRSFLPAAVRLYNCTQ